MTTHRPQRSGRPRFPFFKDETGAGRISSHVTLKASIRAVIISVMIATVVVGVAIWWAVGKVGDLDSLIAQRHSDNANFQAQIEKLVAQNKQDAFNDVAQLACSVVALYPAGTSPFIDQLAATYDCPPYVAPSISTSTLPSPTPSPTSSSAPRASAHASPSAHAGAAPLSTTVEASVDKSPTASPTPTASATPTPLLDLGVTCRLLGLLC